MNNYNDFPLLGQDEYFLLANEYDKTIQTYDRKSQLALIINSLESSLHSCMSADKNINYKIRQAIENTLNEISRILDNLYSSFNISNDISSRKNIITFNIFSLLKQINQSTIHFQYFYENEEKIYYKKIASNSIQTLLNCSDIIIDKLEKCNIQIFKHM